MSNNYKISIHTADERGAGTDSNIFLVFRGVLGRSGEYRLNGYLSGNAFERNDTDDLTLALGKLGDIYEIQLRSDCSYAGSDWRVNWIKIKNPSGTVSEFHINEWINNEKTYTYNDVTLYRKEEITTSEANVYSSASYFVPANTEIVVTDSVSVKTGYRISETKVSELSTTTETRCEAGIDAIKASVSFALTSKVSDANMQEISKETIKTCTQQITFPIVAEPKKYRAVYIQQIDNHKLSIGDFILDVPAVIDQRGAGFIEVKE